MNWQKKKTVKNINTKFSILRLENPLLLISLKKISQSNKHKCWKESSFLGLDERIRLQNLENTNYIKLKWGFQPFSWQLYSLIWSLGYYKVLLDVRRVVELNMSFFCQRKVPSLVTRKFVSFLWKEKRKQGNQYNVAQMSQKMRRL